MPRVYHALVIGCGRIGSRFDETGSTTISSHAGGYIQEPRVHLAGLCDIDKARAKEAALFWGVDQWFNDPIMALQEVRPDIVSVCTPDETHAEILDAALETQSVRAILAEKPMALSTAEAKRIAYKATERSVVIVVNYSRRFQSAYRRAKSALSEGRIGSVHSITGYYSRGILHNGTHWIDLARWFVGEVTSVRADPAIVESERDPTPDVRFEFESGAIGHLKGIDQRAYALFEMDILGETGRLRITQGPRFSWYARHTHPTRPEFCYLQEQTSEAASPESAIVAAVANICDCLEKKSAPICSADDASRAIEIAEACIRSLNLGDHIRLA